MSKILRILLGFFLVGALALVCFVLYAIWPFLPTMWSDGRQIKALQSRTDYPEIARAMVALHRQATNSAGEPVKLIKPDDSLVPPVLRALSPRSIQNSEHQLTMEFHGGFDHYGYRIRQSETNRTLWTMLWYTESGESPLVTISQE